MAEDAIFNGGMRGLGKRAACGCVTVTGAALTLLTALPRGGKVVAVGEVAVAVGVGAGSGVRIIRGCAGAALGHGGGEHIAEHHFRLAGGGRVDMNWIVKIRGHVVAIRARDCYGSAGTTFEMRGVTAVPLRVDLLGLRVAVAKVTCLGTTIGCIVATAGAA